MCAITFNRVTMNQLQNVSINGVRYSLHQTADNFHGLWAMGMITEDEWEYYWHLFMDISLGLQTANGEEEVKWPGEDEYRPLMDFMVHFGVRVPGGRANPIEILDDDISEGTTLTQLSEEDVFAMLNDYISSDIEEFIEDDSY